MHGVLRLIQNELSKILHQMSWKIMTLLLLLLSIGAPVLSYALTAVYSDGEDYISNAEEKAKECEEGSIIKEYYLTVAEAYNYFIDLGFTENTWQYRYIFPDYLRRVKTIKACRLYIEGADLKELTDNYFSIYGLRAYWDNEKEQWIYIYMGDFGEQTSRISENGTVDISFGYEEERETPFTPEIAKKILESEEKALKEVEADAKKSLAEFIGAQMEVFEPAYEEAKEQYEAAKLTYERDKSTVREYTAAKLIKESYDILFDAIGRTDFSEFEKNLHSTYQSLLLRAFNIAREGGAYAQMSEKEFNDNSRSVYFEGYYYEDYDDYVRAAEQRQQQYYRTVKKFAYCLQHNIPIIPDWTNMVLLTTEECLKVNLTVIMLMGIFMAAVIVASEHTSGAVRLLMIRPRARWKILLSKLCCLFIFVTGWIASSSVLTTVTGGIIYGWDDMFMPYVMVGNEAYEVTPLLYFIEEMTVSYLPGISMICLAFLFSALIRRGVVSMAIPMIIYIFGGSASTLFVGKACKVCPPLMFTPIPYFNLASFWREPISQLNAYNSPLDHGLTLNMGVLMFIVYSLLLLALSFIVFKKQQIKN